ncbi:MAG: acetyl-CoA carboxylase biotin carboxyl carrier protein subunit [Nitrososphaera sp.]|uniref:Putative biotin/lipoyl attachment domain-containing protein n=1 Tax=Nitrososphaera gargensis (strain Ga9.2) TaxID=1237085 RepID=K0IEA5_NITGG|nr:acetyl-CoA carboxylase biotin carboxyl carrier protein subunit [Candidatus Nitrososphaera gargensis]AFU57138.1 putative biotin/lipoyl attachment domain-containing protein [Candidatus Nitrososphaera gargensis Ga9.2]
MEFKVGDLAEMLEGEVLRTTDNNSVLVRIAGKQHALRLLKAGTNEFEFVLDNTFHHAKILQSGSAEVKLVLDGQPLTVKKHSKLTEVLEKASALSGAGGGDRNLTSQIPGRVVNIAAKAGTEVKKGDVIVVLESMKMQVAVKAHKDGNLKEIKVKQGASVARNDVLAVIE